MRRRLLRGLAAAVVLPAVVCSKQPGPASGRGSPSSVAVELVDSVVFEDEAGNGGVLYRVAVRSDSGRKLIPHLLTQTAPVIVGDSVALGVAFDSGGAPTYTFRYRVARHVTDTLPLPPGYNPTLSGAAISPDGRHVAYIRFPGNATATGVVRVWPAGPVVIETPVVSVPAGDGLSGEAEWLDAETFRLFVDTFADTTGRWLRFTGNLRAGVQATDTIVAGRRSE